MKKLDEKKEQVAGRMKGEGEYSKLRFTPKSKSEERKFKKYFQKGKQSLERATGKAGKDLRSNMLSEKNEHNRP